MGKSPTPPDPIATSNAQSGFNTRTATTQQELNMVDQNTPWGSLKYSQNGTNADGTPKFQSDVTASPLGQKLLDSGSALASSGAGAFSGKPLDLSYGATEAKLNELNRHTLDPQWQHNTDMEEQKLYNRGVRPGTDAYDSEMRNFNGAKNNAYDQMYLSGHGQAVSDLTNEYNSPLTTFNALRTGASPSFATTPQTGVQGVNYAGQVQDQYGQQVAQSNAEMGGLFGLGGTLLSAGMGGFGKGGAFAPGGRFG